MRPNPQFPADLVIFTEEILNSKLHFWCSGNRFNCKKTATYYFIGTFPQFLVIFKMLRKYGYTCKNWRKRQKTKLKTLWCIANPHTFPVNNNIIFHYLQTPERFRIFESHFCPVKKISYISFATTLSEFDKIGHAQISVPSILPAIYQYKM